MPLTLYSYPLSANAYRVRLFLSLENISCQLRTVDLASGEQNRPEFLALNPAAQVPVLQDGDLVLTDSHAIVVYLARNHGDPLWLGSSSEEEARILSWLFFDANELHNGIGYARNHYLFGLGNDGPGYHWRGARALAVLESSLKGRDWLIGDRPTLADIGCFPLVSVCRQAHLSLDDHPAVQGWVARIQALEGFLSIQD